MTFAAEPADSTGSGAGRVAAEASGCLVAPPVFKTGERCAAALAGSIPVRLRYLRVRAYSETETPGLGEPVMKVRRVIAVAVCGLAVVVAGCKSGGSTSSSATPAGGPSASASASASMDAALCADAAALQNSVTKLSHVNVRSGVGAITADLNQVTADVNTLASQAHGQYAAQTTELKSELAALRTAVSNLSAQHSTSAASAVVTGIAHVTTTAHSLLSAVESHCRSASPGPSA
jgi:hypothetical protein